MEIKVESIYKVFSYYFSTCWLHLRYPEYEIEVREALYFMTLDDVEKYIRIEGNSYRSFMKDHPDDINYKYAYVVLEIPLGYETHTEVLGENLSTRIYLPDGTLWGVNTYADFIPHSSTGDEYNFWGMKNMFYGRKPDEIRFKPGDIVEIMGYPGNHYWSNDSASLAIIIEVPPTIDDMSETQKRYIETHSGHDICDHALCREFGHQLDTYKVLSLLSDEIDHAPTISVFRPKLFVSKRKRRLLVEWYEKYREVNYLK